MTDSRRKIERIYQAAVAAVDPRVSVRRALADALNSSGPFSPTLSGGQFGGVYVIAFGKAAPAMALGAIDAFAERVKSGIVVTKVPVTDGHPTMTYHVGSHPIPDQRSLDAGSDVISFAAKIPEDALVLCLISGGGSALIESLKPGVGLDDLGRVTKALLRSGAPIEELNAVRSRLSRIKGGGLLHALGDRRVTNLIISDVLGDDLQAIASGPTIPAAEPSSAEEIVSRYAVDVTLPPASPAPVSSNVESLVIANINTALDAAAIEAESLGLRPVLLTDRMEGEAREMGKIIARILHGSSLPRSVLKVGDCVLAGGETTVTVRGEGAGGRNTEGALAAAIALSEIRGITVGFLATDGDDGTTSAAGAIIDGATISPETMEGARRALEANDSCGFLGEAGAVWSPGATGTNVNDLMIAIIE